MRIKERTGEVVFGEYTISDFDENTLWIKHYSGEGGQFKKSDFFKLLDSFYKENF